MCVFPQRNQGLVYIFLATVLFFIMWRRGQAPRIDEIFGVFPFGITAGDNNLAGEIAAEKERRLVEDEL